MKLRNLAEPSTEQQLGEADGAGEILKDVGNVPCVAKTPVKKEDIRTTQGGLVLVEVMSQLCPHTSYPASARVDAKLWSCLPGRDPDAEK